MELQIPCGICTKDLQKIYDIGEMWEGKVNEISPNCLYTVWGYRMDSIVC